MVSALPMLLGADKHLFALHYAGSGTGAPVLVCPPLLDEGTRCHWLLRQTCHALAALGRDALLIHFTGHGYSDHSDRPPTLERWQEDMALAIERLQRLAPDAAGLDLLACRFATALIPAGSRWGTAVLWDPVVEGSHWLEELDQKRARLHARPGGHRLKPQEYAGRVLHPALEEMLKGQDATRSEFACEHLVEVYSLGVATAALQTTATQRSKEDHAIDCDWTLPRERLVHDPTLLALLLKPWQQST